MRKFKSNQELYDAIVTTIAPMWGASSLQVIQTTKDVEISAKKGQPDFIPGHIIQALMPILKQAYWYIGAYGHPESVPTMVVYLSL